MRIQVRKLNTQVNLPEYHSKEASGFDLAASLNAPEWVPPGGFAAIPTGLSFQVPQGYEVQVRPRSGIGSKGLVAMFGTVDSDYRGEVKVILFNFSREPVIIPNGMRIAQGVLSPMMQAEIVETQELNQTTRGLNGFGSTGEY